VSLFLRRSDYFWADLFKRVDWYRDHAGPDIAERFVNVLEATLESLRRTPALGRPRFRGRSDLAGLHSFRVHRPFHRILIFYRFDAEYFQVERLIHGARDLPRRLRQSPYDESD
jgi:toxin ParE1/3/4